MEVSNQKKIEDIIAFLLPAIVIFGNYGLNGFRVFGIVVTAGRLLIPLICIYLLADAVVKRRGKPASHPKENLLLAILSVWIIYGAATILFMPYADFREGALELLALLLGVMTVVSIVILCRKGQWDYIVSGLKIAILITMLIGVYEIITGNHLNTSRFCDPEFIRINKEILGEEADSVRWYIATSIFYNENDYSAMLAVFAPLLYCGQRNKYEYSKVANLIMINLCFAIIFFDNAFICFIAFLTGMAIVVLFGTENNRDKIIVFISLVLTRIAVHFVEKLIGLKLGMGATLLAQIDNRMNGTGSLAYRLNTYKITLLETFSTSKGFGFGAGSFTNYFSQFVDSRKIMPNPHCFWFEILAEYGILILLLFAGVLVALMVTLVSKYRQSKETKYIAAIASGSALIMACVAPSTYLKNAYYWISIALAVFLADSNGGLLDGLD